MRRYICLDCGPDQKQFEVYAIHHLYVYTDEHGEWQEDGDTLEVEHGDKYRCVNDPNHRVEYREVTNIDRMKEAVDGRGRGDPGGDREAGGSDAGGGG